MSTNDGIRVDRRTAIKWVVAASAALQLPEMAFGAGTGAVAIGYGKDPELLRTYEPGALWPLTFTGEQRRIAAALCDLIIPADDRSPAASAVGVVDFLDEWISAPYPDHARDREIVVQGMKWLETESQRRFDASFAALSTAQMTAICEDISGSNAAPELIDAAAFFARYRDLAAGGFYTTPAGRKDLGYVGNVPLATFDGPPREALRQIGLR